MNKCVNKSVLVMTFAVNSGEICTLDFGINTKFEFKELDNGFVELTKKYITFKITKEEFDNKFKIIVSKTKIQKDNNYSRHKNANDKFKIWLEKM